MGEFLVNVLVQLMSLQGVVLVTRDDGQWEKEVVSNKDRLFPLWMTMKRMTMMMWSWKMSWEQTLPLCSQMQMWGLVVVSLVFAAAESTRFAQRRLLLVMELIRMPKSPFSLSPFSTTWRVDKWYQ